MIHVVAMEKVNACKQAAWRHGQISMLRVKIAHWARSYRVGEVLAVDRGYQWSGVESLRHNESPVPWYIQYYANQGVYGCLLDQDVIAPSPKDMEISLLGRNSCCNPISYPREQNL